MFMDNSQTQGESVCLVQRSEHSCLSPLPLSGLINYASSISEKTSEDDKFCGQSVPSYGGQTVCVGGGHTNRLETL